MQKRHKNRQQYFNEQATTTAKYVVPFLQQVTDIDQNTTVLEIGCGEGGNLKAFLDLGCKKVVGIDMAEVRIEQAKQFFAGHKFEQNIELIAADIYKIKNLPKFDVIITRDVLEHIHGQEKFMKFVRNFLKPEGKFFLGFPPWQNPFGGHQQICRSKILSKLPFFHILPKQIYRSILKIFGETPKMQEVLLEIKQTGITIERFERILKNTDYKIDKRIFYFINPNYQIKFDLKPRKQLELISAIPYFRNYFITTNYYIVSS